MEYVTLDQANTNIIGMGGIMKNPKLKDRARRVATLHPDVTVLFADIVGEFGGSSGSCQFRRMRMLNNLVEGNVGCTTRAE
jgi:hypothetical protein